MGDGGVLKQVLPAVERTGPLESGVLCLTSGTSIDCPQTSPVFMRIKCTYVPSSSHEMWQMLRPYRPEFPLLDWNCVPIQM